MDEREPTGSHHAFRDATSREGRVSRVCLRIEEVIRPLR